MWNARFDARIRCSIRLAHRIFEGEDRDRTPLRGFYAHVMGNHRSVLHMFDNSRIVDAPATAGISKLLPVDRRGGRGINRPVTKP